MIDVQQRLKGGKVKRYHTLDTLKENTVGQHTFNMLIIADAVYKRAPPPTLMQAILYHDLHEVYTGDTPFYTKRDNPAFNNTLKELEHLINVRMSTCTSLTIEEGCILRFIDILEAISFLVDERMLGNVGVNGAYCTTSKLLISLYPDNLSPVWQNLCGLHQDLMDRWSEAIA